MARNGNHLEKQMQDEVWLTDGGQVAVMFEHARKKTVMGTYTAGTNEHQIVFWGQRNNLPDEREALIANNNFAPQIIRAKRDIIIGGGLICYKEHYDNKEKVIEEVEMPAQFEDFVEANEEQFGGLHEMCGSLLMHGQYYVELIRNGKGEPQFIKPQLARHVRAEKQNKHGRIPNYWLYGGWSNVASQQRLSEVTNMQSIPAFDYTTTQNHALYQGADRLLGGPYYYDPHYAGSTAWLKVANLIPQFHLGNLQNGFNIRYLIKVPEDYFMRSLSDAQRKDTEKVKQHLRSAKHNFKTKLNSFLQGAENAGRGLIVTKHIYKHIQREWPELEIVPLEVDLKDEAMLKLFESSNQAATSAHGIPPVLAGLATGAKMTSGSEIRNLYNFWQISATPMPRKTLLKPFKWAWKGFELDKDIKLGFRNTELTTTDKNPTGNTQSIENNE